MYNILCNKPQFAESPENRLDAQREGARSKVGRPAELQSAATLGLSHLNLTRYIGMKL